MDTSAFLCACLSVNLSTYISVMEIQGTAAILRAARQVARDERARFVVAVSGGLDSMVLLHAMARTIPKQIAAVATFDHASGPAAALAVEHVRSAADALELPFVVGRAEAPLDIREGWEAAWRDARYAFL